MAEIMRLSLCNLRCLYFCLSSLNNALWKTKVFLRICGSASIWRLAFAFGESVCSIFFFSLSNRWRYLCTFWMAFSSFALLSYNAVYTFIRCLATFLLPLSFWDSVDCGVGCRSTTFPSGMAGSGDCGGVVVVR